MRMRPKISERPAASRKRSMPNDTPLRVWIAQKVMRSPNLMAAAIAQRTKRIKIGVFGNLAALHAHPVRLAEETAMLDVMSGGRLISGFVRGVPQEYLALSVPISEARERLNEAWDLIVKAWTTHEPFDWRGKYWHYDRVSIWPRPLQQPHPPIMMPADSDEGLETAARRRVGTGVAYRSVGRAKVAFEKYRAFAARHGWTPGPEHCHLLRNVYVAETNQRARDEAEEHLHYMFQRLLSYHRGSMKLLGQSPPRRPAEIRSAEDLPFYEMDFGVLAPVTGVFASFAKDIVDGAQLYHAESGGQLGGRKLELIVEDYQVRPDVAVTKMRKLAEQDRVH